MKLQIKIKMNEGLYLRDPEQTDLGRNIIKYSIELIVNFGIETFTFKKLAETINSTEAGIYRYFENKHLLLTYLVSWYWSWMEYQIDYQTNNIKDSKEKLIRIIELLTIVEDDQTTSHVDEALLHKIVISEGAKVYLTKQVSDDNQHLFFSPYKELCSNIANVILAYNPSYKYPKSLASTIIEIAHFQTFFMRNLTSLTDFQKSDDEYRVVSFINNLVFSTIKR